MSNRKLIVAAAAAVIAIGTAYSNFFRNSFHFDDAHVIESNVYIRSLANAPKFFTDAHTFSSLPQNATYRPLVTLSYAIDYRLGHGLNPVAFHATQLALLLILGVLLAIFFGALVDPWIALAAAAIFAIHTANTETMNFISSRSELLSAIGLLIAFIMWQRGSRIAYLIPLAIGALAKAPVVVFGPLLFAYAMLIERRTWRDALRSAIPSTVTGVFLLAFLGRMNAPEWTSGGGSAYHYAITQPFVWFHYVRLFFLPAGLTADTDWQPFSSIFDTRAIAGFVFAVALIAFARHIARRDELRPAAFGIAWFFVALIPASSVFPLAEVTNDHRMFFPFVGLTLAVVVLAHAYLPRPVFEFAVIAAIIALGIGTHARNRAWATEETLWADVVEKSPNNGRAWMNYGLTQMGAGRYAAARSAYDRAALILPNYSFLEINRGIVDGATGDARSAESHFRRALSLNDDANAHFFYARWLLQVGRGPEGQRHLEIALTKSRSSADVRTLLLRVLAARAGIDAARPLAVETAQLDPDNRAAAELAAGRYPVDAPASYDARFRYGLALIQQQRFVDAAQANRAALQIEPNAAGAHVNLGWSLAKLGFFDEAASELHRGIALQPNDQLARNDLAWVEGQLRK